MHSTEYKLLFLMDLLIKKHCPALPFAQIFVHTVCFEGRKQTRYYLRGWMGGEHDVERNGGFVNS